MRKSGIIGVNNVYRVKKISEVLHKVESVFLPKDTRKNLAFNLLLLKL